MKYFRTYGDLCAFCKNTGTDKNARRKITAWYMGEHVVRWAIPAEYIRSID